MAMPKTQRHSKDGLSRRQVESPKEISHDIVEYLTEYVRENPGYTALFCIGLGFILGWKLKPW